MLSASKRDVSFVLHIGAILGQPVKLARSPLTKVWLASSASFVVCSSYKIIWVGIFQVCDYFFNLPTGFKLVK